MEREREAVEQRMSETERANGLLERLKNSDAELMQKQGVEVCIRFVVFVSEILFYSGF